MKQKQALVSLSALAAFCMQASAAVRLNITAIGAKDGSSTLECWQLDQPFSVSDQPGTAGTAITSVGSVANISFTVLPASFDGGIHNAPYNQWVVFTTGLAHITLPDDNETSAYVSGGEFGMIFAADTAAVSEKGHRTQYPGIVETIALQIPTADGEVPKHDLLHNGPCITSEINGIRGFADGATNSSENVGDHPVVAARASRLLPFGF